MLLGLNPAVRVDINEAGEFQGNRVVSRDTRRVEAARGEGYGR